MLHFDAGRTRDGGMCVDGLYLHSAVALAVVNI
jgi:hypothetical protein